MIIPIKNKLEKNEEEHLFQICKEFGIVLQPIIGTHRTIYAMLGDERDTLLIKKIEGLPFVDRIDRIEAIYKLMAKDSDLKNHVIKIGDKKLGKDFVVIAGHCTIDPKEKSVIKSENNSFLFG